jgi:hypothetical protein
VENRGAQTANCTFFNGLLLFAQFQGSSFFSLDFCGSETQFKIAKRVESERCKNCARIFFMRDAEQRKIFTAQTN